MYCSKRLLANLSHQFLHTTYILPSSKTRWKCFKHRAILKTKHRTVVLPSNVKNYTKPRFMYINRISRCALHCSIPLSLHEPPTVKSSWHSISTMYRKTRTQTTATMEWLVDLRVINTVCDETGVGCSITLAESQITWRLCRTRLVDPRSWKQIGHGVKYSV